MDFDHRDPATRLEIGGKILQVLRALLDVVEDVIDQCEIDVLG